MRKKGFTLIELLVVIAIIAVLMSILMPALNRAKQLAYDAIDKSNQHQFGVFWMMYTDENDSFFPERGGGEAWGEITMGAWPYVLYSYMEAMDENIWLCPAAEVPILSGGRPPHAAWTWPQNANPGDPQSINGSYIANYWVANDPRSKFYKTPNIRGADRVPIMCDGNWKDTEPEPDDAPPPHEHFWWEPDNNEMKRVCINRHGNHINAVMMDLSAKEIGLKSLWRTPWHKEWDMAAPLPNWEVEAPWMVKYPDPPW